MAMHEFHVTESAARVLIDQADKDKGFEIIPRGVLMHVTDGIRRAIVPPESWDSYAVQWPACAPVIDAARAAFLVRQSDARKAREDNE